MNKLLAGLGNFVKSGPFKLGLILAIITALGSFIYYYDNQRYQAGYNAALVELGKADQTTLDERMAAYKLEYEQKKATLQSRAERAEKDSEELRTLLAEKPEVVREVVEVIKNAECKALDQAFIDILNRDIGEVGVE